jgi:hypothetical protein
LRTLPIWQKSRDLCLFGESLENFAYSAKVSDSGKFLRFFWSNLTKNRGDCLFFLFFFALQVPEKSLFIQSGRPQLSTIRQKSKDLCLFGKSPENFAYSAKA